MIIKNSIHQQNEHLTIEHKNTTTYIDVDPCPVLGHAHKYGEVKPGNGVATLLFWVSKSKTNVN